MDPIVLANTNEIGRSPTNTVIQIDGGVLSGLSTKLIPNIKAVETKTGKPMTGFDFKNERGNIV